MGRLQHRGKPHIVSLLRITMFQQFNTKYKGHAMVTSSLLRRASVRAERVLEVDERTADYPKLVLTSNGPHYKPLSTRWQVLALILFGLLSCVAVLEVGLEKGVKVETGSNHKASGKRHRVQNFDTPKAAVVPDGFQVAAASGYPSRPMRPPPPWPLAGMDSTAQSLTAPRKGLATNWNRPYHQL